MELQKLLEKKSFQAASQGVDNSVGCWHFGADMKLRFLLPFSLLLLLAVSTSPSQRFPGPSDNSILKAPPVEIVGYSDRQSFQGESAQQSAGTTGQQRVDLKVIKTVDPDYPAQAVKKHIEGTVVMSIVVGKSGKVSGVTVLSGPPELLQASIDAVNQWEFEPPAKGPVTKTVTLSYALDSCPPGEVDRGEVIFGGRMKSEKRDAVKIVGEVYQPAPPYPPEVRKAGVEGVLVLSITVDSEGKVTDAQVVKSLGPALDAAALDTVRTWRFKVSPNGKPASFPVRFSFTLP
ncbi:MAG: energy transducer TonB [Candidatus Acidiferrales bacterium]